MEYKKLVSSVTKNKGGKMEVMETIKKIVQDLILPELGTIKKENEEIKIFLQSINQRLDNMNAHLVDQSRRIDELRIELKEEINKNTVRIDETNKRIDETNKSLIARIDETNKSLIARIDETNKSLIARIDETNKSLIARIDETNKRIDETNKSLIARIDETNKRIDETNRSLIARIDETNNRIDYLRVELKDEILKTNVRMDRLYEVIVRRDEHNILEMRVGKMEQEITEIKEELLKIAA